MGSDPNSSNMKDFAKWGLTHSTPSPSTATTEADLAHQNLIAINKDLNQRVKDLETSSSYRIGQRLVRVVRPFLVLLGRRSRPSIRPTIAIDSSWPCLQGTITFQEPSTEQTFIEVSASGHQLLSKILSFADYSNSLSEFPATVNFEFGYQLGFEQFPHDALEVSVGGTKFRQIKQNFETLDPQRLCKALDVAIDSIIQIEGDLSEFRTKLKEVRAVALIAMYRDVYRLGDNSQKLIEELQHLGFLTVVIDTSEDRPVTPITCDVYIHRRNVGWDFASWLSVLGRFPWLAAESEHLVFINDSNIGPLKSLTDLFNKGKETDFDVWGVTDSWEIRYHLQSYFLFFGRSALKGGHLQEFASTFSFPVQKNSIIHSGEIGLSQFLIHRGLHLGALFPYSTLTQAFIDSYQDRMTELLNRKENQHRVDQQLDAGSYELNFVLKTVELIRSAAPLNPTHYFWDILIELGSPFIKRELVTKNPELVPGLHRIPQLFTDSVGRAMLRREVELCGRANQSFSLALALNLESALFTHTLGELDIPARPEET